jgi:cytochrome b6-f complex iron-sulfur subunit
MDRRKFIAKSVFASFVLAAGSSYLASCSKDDDPTPDGGGASTGTIVDLSLPQYEELTVDGGFKYVGKMIVVFTGGKYIALSKACTHQGSSIVFDSAANHFVCNNHGATFSTSGAVTKGPASSSLKIYKVTKEGDILTIE